MIPIWLGFTDFGLPPLIADSTLAGSIVSVCVADTVGNVEFEHNARIRVVPGSNQKLIATAFAFERLGTQKRMETRFWKQEGRLVVESQGDPMLRFSDLLAIKDRLSLKGGIPILVKQAYRPMIGPGWEFDDLPNKYAAPVTAFTVDRGSVELWTKDGKVEYRPPHKGLKVVRLAAEKLSIRYDPAIGLVSVSGPLPPGEKRLDTLALPKPDVFAAAVLGGRFEPSPRAPSRTPDFVHRGPALSEVIAECLVKSDNNIAEHLLLSAAASSKPLSDQPYRDAQEQVRAFLTDKVRVDAKDIRVDDGSGLSRHNLVTTRGIVQLLAYGLRQPWGKAWRAGMARAGKGTLASRLAGSTFEGKTGTLDNVVALSGFVSCKDGKDRLVSIIVNHAPTGANLVRERVDAMIRSVESTIGTKIVSEVEREVAVPD